MCFSKKVPSSSLMAVVCSLFPFLSVVSLHHLSHEFLTKRKSRCFPESVDDAGVVSYLWEKVDGPFWKPEGPVDTPVLQLQNLSPGEYTFK